MAHKRGHYVANLVSYSRESEKIEDFLWFHKQNYGVETGGCYDSERIRGKFSGENGVVEF